jgi:hypothetical protein
MVRVDQGDWRKVHFDIYLRTDPYRIIEVPLAGAYERIRVRILAIFAPNSWVRAGYLYQFWGDRFTGTMVSKHFLPLQDELLCKLEPVQQSTLAFRLLPWITEFSIEIFADFSSINPG